MEKWNISDAHLFLITFHSVSQYKPRYQYPAVLDGEAVLDARLKTGNVAYRDWEMS